MNVYIYITTYIIFFQKDKQFHLISCHDSQNIAYICIYIYIYIYTDSFHNSTLFPTPTKFLTTCYQKIHFMANHK